MKRAMIEKKHLVKQERMNKTPALAVFTLQILLENRG